LRFGSATTVPLYAFSGVGADHSVSAASGGGVTDGGRLADKGGVARLHIAQVPKRSQENGRQPVITLREATETEEKFKRNAPGQRVVHLATDHPCFWAGFVATGDWEILCVPSRVTARVNWQVRFAHFLQYRVRDVLSVHRVAGMPR
jgi:hypothetical protein